MKKSISKAILAVIFIPLVFLLVIFIINTAARTSIRDVKTSVQITDSGTTNAEDAAYYETMEEALQDVSMIEDEEDYVKADLSGDPIYTFDGSDAAAVIYSDGEDYTVLYLAKKDGTYSQPMKVFTSTCQPWMETGYHYTYEAEDAVSEYFLTEYALDTKIGTESPVYFGFWKSSDDLGKMTVLGEKMQDITQVTDECYFWTVSGVDAGAALDAVNFEEFTYQDLIDALEIKTE